MRNNDWIFNLLKMKTYEKEQIGKILNLKNGSNTTCLFSDSIQNLFRTNPHKEMLSLFYDLFQQCRTAIF